MPWVQSHKKVWVTLCARPAEAGQGGTLISALTLDSCPLRRLFSATFSHVSPLCYCFHCLKWPPNVGLKCSLVLLSLTEVCCALCCMLDKLHSLNPMSYRVVGCEFNVSESTILFLKVSLNTHKENKGREQLCVDQLMKTLWPEAYRNVTVVPLGTVVQYSVIQWFSTFQKVTTTNNRNQVYLIGVSRENRGKLMSKVADNFPELI